MDSCLSEGRYCDAERKQLCLVLEHTDYISYNDNCYSERASMDGKLKCVVWFTFNFRGLFNFKAILVEFVLFNL